MKSLLPALFLSASLGFAAEDYASEPPLQFVLKIAGKEVQLAAGEEKQLEGEFKNPEMKVEAGKVRRFQKRGISFDYPAGCNWEAEKDGDILTWTLEGPATTVVLTLSPERLQAQDVADELVSVFGETTRISDTTGAFLGREIQGKKVAATISEALIMTHLFSLPVGEGSLLVQIQDSSKEAAGKGGEEFRATMKLLSDTLKLPS